ncbi:hypothetical protein SDC9_171644 [bioreactor metagenome]|uniref:Uncharacterized protein n=1 Tax=bioreactor metagenome TaxID=1076179 RepID=A0A645GEP6_9ZZZZ
MRTAEAYFVRPKRERSEANAKLLMRYVGLACELESENDAILLLSSELHRPGTGYTKAELRTIEKALEALRAGSSG